jgi:hypothetical protein
MGYEPKRTKVQGIRCKDITINLQAPSPKPKPYYCHSHADGNPVILSHRDVTGYWIVTYLIRDMNDRYDFL